MFSTVGSLPNSESETTDHIQTRYSPPETSTRKNTPFPRCRADDVVRCRNHDVYICADQECDSNFDCPDGEDEDKEKCFKGTVFSNAFLTTAWCKTNIFCLHYIYAKLLRHSNL